MVGSLHISYGKGFSLSAGNSHSSQCSFFSLMGQVLNVSYETLVLILRKRRESLFTERVNSPVTPPLMIMKGRTITSNFIDEFLLNRNANISS